MGAAAKSKQENTMHDQDLHALAAPIKTDVAVIPAPGGRPGVYLQSLS